MRSAAVGFQLALYRAGRRELERLPCTQPRSWRVCPGVLHQGRHATEQDSRSLAFRDLSGNMLRFSERRVSWPLPRPPGWVAPRQVRNMLVTSARMLGGLRRRCASLYTIVRMYALQDPMLGLWHPGTMTFVQNRLLVRYPLPVSIGVARDVLGDVSATRIGDNTAHVHLPRLRGEDPILIQPAVLDSLNEEHCYVDGTDPEREAPTSPWGWPLSWNTPDEQTVLAVTQVVMTLEQVMLAQSADVLASCRKELPQWFSTLKDWCEILTKQDLDVVAPRERIRSDGAGWACWYDGDPVRVLPRVIMDLDYGDPVSQTCWDRLVIRAGDGTQPDTEHLLLRDARSAQVRRQFRRAVLDAATAIEIALHLLLVEEYRRNPSPLADERIRLSEHWAMRKLWEEVAGFPNLPRSMTDDLINLRNAVVHKSAKEPTYTESKNMLAAASDLVAIANPINPATAATSSVRRRGR